MRILAFFGLCLRFMLEKFAFLVERHQVSVFDTGIRVYVYALFIIIVVENNTLLVVWMKAITLVVL